MNTDINNIDPKLLEEDDRIVAYLKGQMSAEEELNFLKELKNSPELKERAIIMARLVKGMKEVGSQQDKEMQNVFLASSKDNVETAAEKTIRMDDGERVKAFFGKKKMAQESQAHAESQMTDHTATDLQEEFETLENAKNKSITKTAKWLSIAASLICIVWLGFTYNSYRNTTALGNQYDVELSSSMIIRGQETQTEAEKNLMGLFNKVKNNEDISETIHNLSLCWELSTMETYNDYTNYSSEIGWNLAIAHLKNNDKKEAKVVLEKLISISEEGSAVNEKAKELLSKI